MKKTAGLWLGYFTLVVLSACVQKEDPAGPEVGPASVGEAEIYLPALPHDFLVKRSSGDVDTVVSSDVMFILTLTGPGMAPRKHAWPLGPSTSGPMKVANIPVGNRLFKGELDVKGTITHADSVWVPIQAGKTAQVNLKLAAVSGDAKVCVEIEGFPLPAGCQKPSPTPDLTGCWYFTVPGHPDLGKATMRLLQKGSALEGEVRWANGRVDSSIGSVDAQGLVKMGYGPSPHDWMFSGRYEGTNFVLIGTFLRRTGEPYTPVDIMAFHTSCVTEVKPVIGPITCYEVAQNVDGSGTNGMLSLLEMDAMLYGYFIWNGFTAMPLSGKAADVNGNKGLYLYGDLPRGLSKRSLEQNDPVHYKGQVPPGGGPILFGTIYGTDANGAAGLSQRGTWKGSPITCNPKEIPFILEMHHL